MYRITLEYKIGSETTMAEEFVVREHYGMPIAKLRDAIREALAAELAKWRNRYCPMCHGDLIGQDPMGYHYDHRPNCGMIPL